MKNITTTENETTIKIAIDAQYPILNTFCVLNAIDGKSLAIITYLAEQVDEMGNVYFSYRPLAKKLNVSPTSITNAVKLFIKFNILEKDDSVPNRYKFNKELLSKNKKIILELN